MEEKPGSRYQLPDLSAGRADDDDPLEGQSWPERRDASYEGADWLERWKDAPHIDPEAFRRDIDSILDSSL